MNKIEVQKVPIQKGSGSIGGLPSILGQHSMDKTKESVRYKKEKEESSEVEMSEDEA